jgi:hypothetical protein
MEHLELQDHLMLQQEALQEVLEVMELVGL